MPVFVEKQSSKLEVLLRRTLSIRERSLQLRKKAAETKAILEVNTENDHVRQSWKRERICSHKVTGSSEITLTHSFRQSHFLFCAVNGNSKLQADKDQEHSKPLLRQESKETEICLLRR